MTHMSKPPQKNANECHSPHIHKNSNTWLRISPTYILYVEIMTTRVAKVPTYDFHTFCL